MAHEDGGLPPDGMEPGPSAAAFDSPGTKRPPRDAIVEALMELAGERVWEDISISDIVARANLSLADFREHYPSKGAVLGGFARKIDRIVLDGTTGDLADEPAKEQLFDVLMRRLDALAPYKHGLQGVMDWVRRDPLAAAALNGVVTNSMRFMLAAAGVDVEGGLAAVKMQGLVFAWGRILDVWLEDEDPGQARTMAALDKELSRGETWVARIDDLDKLISPIRIMTRAMMEARKRSRDRRTKKPSPLAEDLNQEITL